MSVKNKISINKLFFPHDDNKNHVKSLDGLRGLAVLFVLLSHASNSGLFILPFLNFEKIGKVGVYLFFILSAYLLDRQIIRHLTTKKTSKSYWMNYFLRRFLRIYPLFIFALFGFYALSLMGLSNIINSLQDVFLHMFLLKGESIFWSIPVEFKYYFISPIFLLICHRYLKWNIQLVTAFILCIGIFSVVLEHIYNLDIISTIRYLPMFLAGTFISVYTSFRKEIFTGKRNAYLLTCAGIFSFLMIILTFPYYFSLIFGFSVDFRSSIFYSLYSVLWAIILLASLYGTKMISSILEIKFLRLIGNISFSLYLLHLPILKFIELNTHIPTFIKIYLFLFLSILISCGTYLIIEKPLSKIRIKN